MKPAAIANYLNRFSVLVIGRLGGALAVFMVNILVVRYLGIEALGQFAIFVSLVSILTICLPIGFSSVASIFATEYTTKNQPGLLKGYLFTALKNLFLVSGLIALFISVMGYLVPQLLLGNSLIFAIIVLVTAIATSLLNLNSATMIGLKRQIAGLLPETLIRPLLMLSGTFVLLEIFNSVNLFAVMSIAALASWLAVVFVYFTDSKFRRSIVGTKMERDLPRWKKATYPWMATSLLWDYMIDIVLLVTAFVSGAAEVAILHICFRYRVLAGFGMRTIYTLLMPEITESKVNKNLTEVNRKLIQANIASIAYSIVVLAVFVVIGEWLLGLFSPEISQGWVILIIVSLTMLFRAIFGPAPLVLAIHNLHVVTAVISGFGLVIALGIILLFYQEFGLLAAAVGYSLANLFVSLVLWKYAKNKTGIDCSIFSILRPAQTKTA
ncbi:MAG: hypothetical protein L3J32_03395 [Rhizobiaceae bacterium]|nr:hypothetical protein [Rhizobiaceae bacterium]